MDSVVDLLVLLTLHWRVGISTLIALVVAVFLSTALTAFSGWFGVPLVILGFGAGLLWEGSALSSTRQHDHR
ncbi:hypothetical protein AVKW3434_14760 [Acidovorax sp. SUPP3434]|uniref:hypothetical protein n=1 Tax=Acidovorax sp. SUPP3434 TaxID=2920880 RepID=UPI0023DE4E5A|nr:hypothetical protein [Acidovorax sp. SUPP3434]GKT00663.1 hypothetical protein AVKW3434_14760 [Acidovorax sp. SUPP3434]